MTQIDLNQNIIAALGLQNAPEEMRMEILDRCVNLVMRRLMVSLMDSLPEADVEEANRLADNPQELLDFMASKVEDFPAMIQAEAEKVRNELVLNCAIPKNLE